MGIRRVMRKSMRETAFRLARRDLALFLKDHERELLHVFREELQRLDDEIPEERFFIDIKMVPLGEMILKAALHAITRFLTEDVTISPASGSTVGTPVLEEPVPDPVQS